MLQGTLDLMVLQTMATPALHGYDRRAARQVRPAPCASTWARCIPAVLEQRGLVRGKWGVTENNQARFYTITAAGRRQLATEKAEGSHHPSCRRSERSVSPCPRCANRSVAVGHVEPEAIGSRPRRGAPPPGAGR